MMSKIDLRQFCPCNDVPSELSHEVIFSVNSAYKLKKEVKRASIYRIPYLQKFYNCSKQQIIHILKYSEYLKLTWLLDSKLQTF